VESTIRASGEEPFAFHRIVVVVCAVVRKIVPIEKLPRGNSRWILTTFDAVYIMMAGACPTANDNL